MLKRLLPIIFLCLFTSVLGYAQGLGLTYPYILTYPNITCSPQSCNSYLQIGPRWYGGVSVFAQGSCVNGIRPYVTPSQVEFNCSYPSTLLYAYAYVSSAPNIYYMSFGQINAQQLTGQNGTYGYIGGTWVNVFAGSQFSDCYTGALRNFQPPPHPC